MEVTGTAVGFWIDNIAKVIQSLAALATVFFAWRGIKATVQSSREARAAHARSEAEAREERRRIENEQRMNKFMDDQMNRAAEFKAVTAERLRDVLIQIGEVEAALLSGAGLNAARARLKSTIEASGQALSKAYALGTISTPLTVDLITEAKSEVITAISKVTTS